MAALQKAIFKNPYPDYLIFKTSNFSHVCIADAISN